MRHNFRELNIWKDSMSITRSVYTLTSELPNEEKYGLKSQINRSAVSIPSNIAEGSGRTSDNEFIHFLNIALSSSYELETQLILLNDIYKIDLNNILIDLQNLQRMVGGFKKTLRPKDNLVLKS
ncbi:MAG: four helix bundle protein [Crocinitomicaceae bacterium]